MALLLNIDTATEHASVCLSKDGVVLALEESLEQKNHASFLQPAIKKITDDTKTPLATIDAIVVTEGPGSYTGLRVGMASAKGLCYALNKPLILLNTLKVMAAAVLLEPIFKEDKQAFICPMIDARRQEVFTAMYNFSLEPIILPSAVILNEESFSEQLAKNVVIFSGSGHKKFKDMFAVTKPNAMFSSVKYNALHMVNLGEECFFTQNFANLAYSEPYYLKEFFSPLPKKI